MKTADWMKTDGEWIQRGAREKVLGALPKNILDLIHEIETFAGAEIAFDPAPYWNNVLEGYWKEFPWNGVSEPDRRMRCLLGWLSLPLVDSDMLISDIRQKVASVGYLSDAEKLLKRVQSLSSKDRIASAALRFLKIPRTYFAMVVLDIRNRKSERLVIPEH